MSLLLSLFLRARIKLGGELVRARNACFSGEEEEDEEEEENGSE